MNEEVFNIQIRKFLKNVGPIKARYICSIDTVGENNIKKTPLLKTSSEFKVLRQTSVNYQNLYNYNPKNFENDAEPPVCAWLYEGIFNSNYQNRSVSKDFKKFINENKNNSKNCWISSLVIGVTANKHVDFFC